MLRSICLLALVALALPAVAEAGPARTRPVVSAPLSDRAAAARVDRSNWEPRPSNSAENRRVPTRQRLFAED